jgi:polysaccharide pyruvyl transferase WcaK-like protein
MLQDRSSQLYIPYVTKTLILAKLFGIPRFIYAPGLGPVVNKFGKFLSKFALAGSKVLIVRDKESHGFLKEIRLRQSIEVTGDPGFSLKTQYDEPSRQIADNPVIGFAPRRLFYRKGSWLPVSLQLSSQKMVNSRLERFLPLMKLCLRYFCLMYNCPSFSTNPSGSSISTPHLYYLKSMILIGPFY